MTEREALKRLVDRLPETEVHAALRFVEYLGDRTAADPVAAALSTAPSDEEALTAEEAEALEDRDTISHEEARLRLLG